MGHGSWLTRCNIYLRVVVVDVDDDNGRAHAARADGTLSDGANVFAAILLCDVQYVFYVCIIIKTKTAPVNTYDHMVNCLLTTTCMDTSNTPMSMYI